MAQKFKFLSLKTREEIFFYASKSGHFAHCVWGTKNIRDRKFCGHTVEAVLASGMGK